MRITLEQGWGKWNKDYITMLVRPDPEDKHYRPSSYMPKHNEIYEMIEKLLSCEPLAKRTILTKGFLDAIEKGNATAELNKDTPKVNGKKIVIAETSVVNQLLVKAS